MTRYRTFAVALRPRDSVLPMYPVTGNLLLMGRRCRLLPLLTGYNTASAAVVLHGRHPGRDDDGPLLCRASSARFWRQVADASPKRSISPSGPGRNRGRCPQNARSFARSCRDATTTLSAKGAVSATAAGLETGSWTRNEHVVMLLSNRRQPLSSR